MVQATAHSGSDYFNYKKHIALYYLLLIPKYEFTLVDMSDAGRQSDGGVYTALITINRPPEEKILNAGQTYPYVFVADDGFQLKTFMLKPLLV